MTLLEPRNYYKPFEMEWAFEAYELQNKMHWVASEVPLHEDVSDWNKVLTQNEKDLLTQLFRFFTQADVDIAAGYIDKYMPIFQKPELRMMFSAFANMEAIHVHAYSLLIDTIGMPETEYKAFHEYEEMAEKHNYLQKVNPGVVLENTWEGEATREDYLKEIAKTIAVYSVFGEGLQLFSSFAILLNFSRFNKMKGMSQIVTLSIRDESLHVESMIKLFHAFIDQNKKIWKSDLKKEIYQACRDMVALEDKFIDLAFAQGGVQGLEADEVKQYIRFIADRRLLQLGLKPEYKVKKNPLEWLDWTLNGVEHTNFFENRATEYSKGTMTGSWEDVWCKVDSTPRGLGEG